MRCIATDYSSRVARRGIASIFVAASVFCVVWPTHARGETAQNADAKSESNGLVATQRVRVAGIVLKWLRTEKEANYVARRKVDHGSCAGRGETCMYDRVLSRRLCD